MAGDDDIHPECGKPWSEHREILIDGWWPYVLCEAHDFPDADTFSMGEAIERLIALSNRDFSTESREKMSESGSAMPDGSFPIPDRDALRRAIQSFGRGSGDKEKIKAHIKKRAKDLNAEDMLPDDWQ